MAVRRGSRDDDLTLELTEQFEQLYRHLREYNDRQFKKDLSKALRNTAQPILNEIKTKIRNMTVTGTRGGGGRQRATARGRRRGLRQMVASGVRMIVSTSRNPSIRLVVDSSRLPTDQRNLPRALNNPGGWRHPVFGDTSHWVEQHGEPYWESTIEPKAQEFREALREEMARQLRRIEDTSA